ncbi:MAG TPA: alpha/beta hydrolase [Candidatus Limnocylindrales bacterium]
MTGPAGELNIDPAAAPDPDPAAEPAGFVVVVEPNDRIHFLDWGGPASDVATEPASGPQRNPLSPGPPVLLIHGLSNTAWSWARVARRLCRVCRTVALDLRGHGLSDAPTEGYDAATFAADAIAVAEGAGLLDAEPVVLAGHGFGAIVAAWTAATLGDRCGGLVLVDGGWENLRESTGLEPNEFLPTIEEPPEVLRSMASFLADRAAFDAETWDADEERAARAAVVELPAGRVVASSRPHATAASVAAMFEYDPLAVLPRVTAPIVALVAGGAESAARDAALDAARAALVATGRAPIAIARFPANGHNLPRYRPAEVAAAILAVPAGTTPPRDRPRAD